MKSELSTLQQVDGLYRLANLRFLRLTGLLKEQEDAVEKSQSLRDQCNARLIELHQSLDTLREQWQGQRNVTVNELKMQMYDDNARQKEIDQGTLKLLKLTEERDSAISEMHAIQRRLHELKLRNDVLKKKLSFRLALATNRRIARGAEREEDEFSQRGCL